jgi:hypothetical protein
MIYQVFKRFVFNCLAPAKGKFSDFYLIKKMINKQFTTETIKYFEYNPKIWSLASSPLASSFTETVGTTKLAPSVTKLIALMIPVAKVL